MPWKEDICSACVSQEELKGDIASMLGNLGQGDAATVRREMESELRLCEAAGSSLGRRNGVDLDELLEGHDD